MENLGTHPAIIIGRIIQRLLLVWNESLKVGAYRSKPDVGHHEVCTSIHFAVDLQL